MTDDELARIEAAWAAASGAVWRVEERYDGTYKLYAVNPPHLHDSYLMDLGSFDANGPANVAAVGRAAQDVAALIAEVKRLRALVSDDPEALPYWASVGDLWAGPFHSRNEADLWMSGPRAPAGKRFYCQAADLDAAMDERKRIRSMSTPTR